MRVVVPQGCRPPRLPIPLHTHDPRAFSSMHLQRAVRTVLDGTRGGRGWALALWPLRLILTPHAHPFSSGRRGYDFMFSMLLCLVCSVCICCACLHWVRCWLPAATPGSVSLSSDGSLVFVGTAQGEVVVVNSRGDTGTKSSFQAFDAGTAIAVLPAVTPVPAGDTNPDSIAATAAQTPVAAPTPAAGAAPAAAAAAAAAPAAVAAPSSAAAATKKDPKAGKVKGVGFSTGLGSAGGGDGDGEDGAGTGRASGSKKPKPRAPPAVWSPMAAQRGWLVACGAVGPEGGALLRVLHWLPPSGEDLGVEWRHLASASLPAPLLSLSFSGDARYPLLLNLFLFLFLFLFLSFPWHAYLQDLVRVHG